MPRRNETEARKPKSAAPEKTMSRAAIYLRTAVFPGGHSLEKQKRDIGEYAARHNMEIVAVYADEGKSGIAVDGREGFKHLLADVRSGKPGFSDILMLDVSRWGRFQNPDEAGHYEQICRKGGCELHFVDERPHAKALAPQNRN